MVGSAEEADELNDAYKRDPPCRSRPPNLNPKTAYVSEPPLDR